MLDDIGPWDFTFDEEVEELLRIEHDGTIRIDDIVMDAEELVRRVKATKCLSAEDAMASVEATNELAEVAREVGLLDVRYVVKDDDPLLQYARVLSDE